MILPTAPLAGILALGLHPVVLLLERGDAADAPGPRTGDDRELGIHADRKDLTMNNPPNPGIPALLLAAAQRLGWRDTGRRTRTGDAIGVLTDGQTDTLLRLAGAGGDHVVWALDGDALIPHGLTSLAYRALREGTVSDDGTVLLDGVAYRLAATWTGTEAVALAVPARSAAA